jgi:hypothetical protein
MTEQPKCHEAAHSSTPWFVGYYDDSGMGPDGWCITNNNRIDSVIMSGYSFGGVYGVTNEADANLIVAAVNAYANPDTVTVPREMLTALPPPDKLRILADWLDLKDAHADWLDLKDAHAANVNNEIQRDLRKWADVIDVIDARLEGE